MFRISSSCWCLSNSQYEAPGNGEEWRSKRVERDTLYIHTYYLLAANTDQFRIGLPSPSLPLIFSLKERWSLKFRSKDSNTFNGFFSISMRILTFDLSLSAFHFFHLSRRLPYECNVTESHDWWFITHSWFKISFITVTAKNNEQRREGGAKKFGRLKFYAELFFHLLLVVLYVCKLSTIQHIPKLPSFF